MQGRVIDCQGRQAKVVDHAGISYWSKLPYCLRILLENGLRNEPNARKKWVGCFSDWFQGKSAEINFYPARVLMQDLTGVPALVDLAAMREAMQSMGGQIGGINPKCQVDLVVDHSIIVDYTNSPSAFAQNVSREISRNKERYAFLKWAQGAFTNLRIVPPGKGICHQINLEYLADVVTEKDGWWFPDSLVGLDSHTTMINGLGVLAWGVGGIEAEAAMLGQPITMNIPKVVGVELKGRLKAGVNATDMVLHLTEKLRQRGVVGKFLEFIGPGAKSLTLAERATISNMAPEYGATCAYFPPDEETMSYLRLTAREESHISIVAHYLKSLDMFWQDDQPTYSETFSVDLSLVESCIAGPKTPDQRIPLPLVKKSLAELKLSCDKTALSDGSVVIAAITSCTNTSNPSVLIAAGLLARNARKKGLVAQSWVKRSFAPGSKVVVDYLQKLGLMEDLEALGFYLVGYGCTTCIGNSGPLDEKIALKIDKEKLTVAAVLSGNRNFEGRVHPQTQLNYLASPALVVAYAIAGNMAINFDQEPLYKEVYLKDIWPSESEIATAMTKIVSASYKKEYASIFKGEADWDEISVNQDKVYSWVADSTYIRKPPFLENTQSHVLTDIHKAKVLAVFGDKVTTDHISPAGSIAIDSAASEYLQSIGQSVEALHSYGARRGNAEVMVRGTFANTRLVNQLVPNNPGGYTLFEKKVMRIYDAAMKYRCPLVIFAGEQYGMGSSRDWAAKGTHLLGVKAVIAKSFERIHRSNLIGMGVLPCLLSDDIELEGDELIYIEGIEAMSAANADLTLVIKSEQGEKTYTLKSAIHTQIELAYYIQGGILPYVLYQLS